MLGQMGMMGAAAGLAAVEEGGAPPTGPPTNASTYNSGTSEDPLTGVQWTNGDPLSSTQTGFSNSVTVDPTSAFQTSPPGVTSQDTGQDSTDIWYVRHSRIGQFSAWVLAGVGFGSGPL